MSEYQYHKDEIDALCQQKGITIIDYDKGVFKVRGSKGDLYDVRFVRRTEDGYGRIWECSCPARVEVCKHIRAVIEVADYNAPADDW